MANTSLKIDLNLLITLKVLLEEKNVSRAAARLNLSQPTVSLQLARLREAFNDPLFIPSYRGMLPTNRALEIHSKLQNGLSLLDEILQPSGKFQPEITRINWKIAASDYVSQTFIYPQVSKIRSIAPQCRLSVIDIQPNKISEDLAKRDIDLAFHVLSEAPQGLRSRHIFSEKYVLAARKDHPLFSNPLNPEKFLDLEFVIVSKSQGGFWGVADDVLKNLNMERKVVMSIPDFSSLVPLIEQTNMVSLIPHRIAKSSPTISFVDPPFHIPSFDIGMLWSEHVHRDPAHKWLRETLVSDWNNK